MFIIDAGPRMSSVISVAKISYGKTMTKSVNLCGERLILRNMFTSALLLALCLAIDGYTVDDIKTKCLPCALGDRKIIHPTICENYFFCNSVGEWQMQFCPSSTYFDERTASCVNPLNDGPNTMCPYIRDNSDNLGVDIRSLDQCVITTTVTTPTKTSTKTSTAATPVTISTPSSVNDRTTTKKPAMNSSTTTILAALLGVTFATLLVVVLGLFFYKRRQKRRRPRNFYTRVKLPESSSISGSNRGAAPTANAVYQSRSLDNQEDIVSPEPVYEVPNSEEAGYMEIPERSSKAYYTEPATTMRPPMPLPSSTYTSPHSPTDNDEYEETGVPEYAACHSDDGTYMHPGTKPAADNHLYSGHVGDPHTYSKPDTFLEVDEPYEYCRPETANPSPNPSYKLDLQAPDTPPPPPVNPPPPDSPPYYVDPVAEELVPGMAAHQYHTLEPLLRKAQ